VWAGQQEASARGVAALALPDWGQGWRAAGQAQGTHIGATPHCAFPPEGEARGVLQARRARLNDAYEAALAATPAA